MLNSIRSYLIAGKEKAAIAFVASAVGTYLVQNGLKLKDIHSWAAIHALIVGVITHQLVYWTTNSK